MSRYTDAAFPTMEPNVPSSNWPIPFIMKDEQTLISIYACIIHGYVWMCNLKVLK